MAPQPGATREETVPPPIGGVTFDLRRRQRLGAVALRGVAATVGCPSACRISASLRISRATARRLGLGGRARPIATRTRRLSGERSTPRIRLKPSRRVLGAIRRGSRDVAATVRVSVQAEGFPRETFKRRVTIVR